MSTLIAHPVAVLIAAGFFIWALTFVWYVSRETPRKDARRRNRRVR